MIYNHKPPTMSRQSICCTLICSFLGLAALGQDHQTNKKTLSRHLREVYDVLKSNWKIKDGSYTVINDAGFAVVKGHYTEGKKSGIWSYYDNNGKLVQQFDFEHDSLVAQANDPASVVHDSFDFLRESMTVALCGGLSRSADRNTASISCSTNGTFLRR